MITQKEALDLIDKYIKNENLKKHVLAVAVIMRELAKRLGEDETTWYLTGLLHDLDYELTINNFSDHGKKTIELLNEKVTPEIKEAVLAHNFEYTGVLPNSKLSKALIAADAVSGLVIATALVMPNKTISEVTIKSLKKKFKDKSFAKGSKRDKILYCEQLGLPLLEFLSLARDALNEISDLLGL
ncbi:MAG: HD domain-containing protein [Candidatus Asgardarchaeia archaeon]